MTARAGRILDAEVRRDAVRADEYRRHGWWGRPSLGDRLAALAEAAPDRVLLTDPLSTVTRASLDNATRAAARQLAGLGIEPGDIVVVRGANSVDLVGLMLAVTATGAVLCPIQDRSTPAEVRFVLDRTGARWFLQCAAGHTNDELVEARVLAAELEEHVHAAVATFDDWAFDVPGLRLEWVGAAPSERVVEDFEPWAACRPGSPCRLLYTSGSTGDPKGVLHTNDTTIFACEVSVQVHRWTEESVGWLILPVTLNWGMFQLYSVLLSGGRGIVRRSFDPDEVLASIGRNEATHIGLPPTGLMRLRERADELGGTYDASLSCLVSAGAPCTDQLLGDLARLFDAPVIEAYGMTEAGWLATTLHEDASGEARGTVGRPTEGTILRVVDAEGHEVATGEIGSVEASGAHVCTGYFRNEERTRESWTDDGWFRTGDRGFVRDDGRLVLAGRDKDAIKHGGHLVSPREIEEILLESAMFQDAAVIGVPDPYYGESILAIVQPVDPDAEVPLEVVLEPVRGRLAKYKWPQDVRVWPEPFPRTTTGKLQKDVLRRRVLGDPS